MKYKTEYDLSLDYFKGIVSYNQTINILIKYGGLTEEQAKEVIIEWSWDYDVQTNSRKKRQRMYI